MVDAIIALSVFLGLTTMITVPLAVIVGFPLVAWTLRAQFRLKERELELRKLEVAEKLRLARLEQIPEYVDTSDPNQLIAWARTDFELELMERQGQENRLTS